MLGGLKKRLIIVCAISVTLVSLTIFGIILGFSISYTNRSADALTDMIADGNGYIPDVLPGGDFITPETRYATRYFTVRLDEHRNTIFANTDFIATVSPTEALDYAERAVERGRERGWISDYRYKLCYASDGAAVVIFVDASASRSFLVRTMSVCAAVLALAAAFILGLIALLSGRAMKPIAESYEKQKQFITDASHELKTPLTLILTNIDIAEAELGENEWLSDIRSEGQRMSELVKRLVELSRMDEEGHGIDMEPVALGRMVSEAVSEFEAPILRSGRRLVSDIDESVVCRGDEALLREVIGILLDNALKYCDCEGEISVTLRYRKGATLTVENSYSDAGSLELSRLFDRFYRADKARGTGGYGVGLSIALSIIHKHRGEISAYAAGEGRVGFCVNLR